MNRINVFLRRRMENTRSVITIQFFQNEILFQDLHLHGLVFQYSLLTTMTIIYASPTLMAKDGTFDHDINVFFQLVGCNKVRDTAS
jgi:hypothetical protein